MITPKPNFMNRLFYITGTLIGFLLIGGCSPDEFLDNKNLLLDGQKLTLDNGIMNFRDLQTFDSVSRYLSNKDTEFLQKWEDSYDVKSIRSVYERAVVEEEKFLENLVKANGDDSSLTREKIGYSEFTKSKLLSEDLLLDEYGVVEMNITSPSLRSILNENRIVKIGGKEYQYGMYEIKRIGSSESIPVSRNSKVIDLKMGRTETSWGASCENINDKYRVIGYEEDWTYSDGNTCNAYWEAQIKIRSLKKILGTWQNYNTGSMSVTADVKILEWYVSSAGLPPYISRVVVDRTNYSYSPGYGHTGYWTFINKLPLNCLPALPLGYTGRAAKYYKRFYRVYGYNSTTCSLGANPFEYCEYGNCSLIGD